MTGFIADTVKAYRKVRRTVRRARRTYKKAKKMLSMLTPKLPDAERRRFEKYLKGSFVYILEMDRGYLRLYYDGSLADECGNFDKITWINGRAIGVDPYTGEPYIRPFARNANGTLRKWKYSEDGELMEVKRRHGIADHFESN